MNPIDPILQVPDARLRQSCAPANESDFGGPELETLIQRLDAARQPFRNIAIAAPQIGVLKRVCLIEIPAREWLVFGLVEPVEKHVLVNPKIVWSSDKTVKALEACLSLRGYQGFVVRPRRVRVEAFTPQGQSVEFEADGLYSRCLQHEIDHLDGVLFPDHIRALRDIQCISAVEADDPILDHNSHTL